MTVIWKFEAKGARSREDAALMAYDALGKAKREDTVFEIGGEELPVARLKSIERLTPREREVALRIAEGDTVKDIARALNLSIKTVETHSYNIFKKTGVHNRVQLAVLIVKLQLTGKSVISDAA